MKLEFSLARGGTRLIVVDAITDDGQLRVECEDEDDDCYVDETVWMYEYETHKDYHNNIDGDTFFTCMSYQVRQTPLRCK